MLGWQSDSESQEGAQGVAEDTEFENICFDIQFRTLKNIHEKAYLSLRYPLTFPF